MESEGNWGGHFPPNIYFGFIQPPRKQTTVLKWLSYVSPISNSLLCYWGNSMLANANMNLSVLDNKWNSTRSMEQRKGMWLENSWRKKNKAGFTNVTASPCGIYGAPPRARCRPGPAGLPRTFVGSFRLIPSLLHPRPAGIHPHHLTRHVNSRSISAAWPALQVPLWLRVYCRAVTHMGDIDSDTQGMGVSLPTVNYNDCVRTASENGECSPTKM